MKKLLLISLVLLTACAPSAKAVQTAIAETQAVWTPVPTLTPHYVIQTEIVVETKIVTPTWTPTPLATPTETVSPLLLPRSDGIYLVNVDIAAGIWRSDGKGSECFWRLTDRTGGTVKNHFGSGGGTVYLPPEGFQILFEDCGTWSFLEAP